MDSILIFETDRIYRINLDILFILFILLILSDKKCLN